MSAGATPSDLMSEPSIPRFRVRGHGFAGGLLRVRHARATRAKSGAALTLLSPVT